MWCAIVAFCVRHVWGTMAISTLLNVAQSESELTLNRYVSLWVIFMLSTTTTTTTRERSDLFDDMPQSAPIVSNYNANRTE